MTTREKTAAPMPETMSPREKVALKPCPFCGSDAILEHDTDHHGGWFNLGCGAPWSADDACPGYHAFYTCDPSEQAASIAAWNRRAALASSGDHAELAGLSDEMVGLIAPSQGERLLEYERHQFEVASRVQSLSRALIAENAALRGEVADMREYRIAADLLVSTLKADLGAAERKLAESEGLLERSIDLMTDEYADTKAYRKDTRIFLSSKEAAWAPSS